jgi:hypothetical protein
MPMTSRWVKGLPPGAEIAPLCTRSAKSFDRGEGVEISVRSSGVGASWGRAQPVVADHAFLVGIGDGAGFERGHVGEGFLHARLHRREEVVGERDAADVEGEPEIAVLVEVFFETGPGHDGRKAEINFMRNSGSQETAKAENC